MYLETLLVLFIYFFIIFVIGQVIKDNSIVDIGWGSGFVVSALYTFLRNSESGIKGFLITVVIVVWGSRLTYHIAKRNIGKPEDYRYVSMRKRWGTRFVMLKAFLNVYVLQWLIQFVVTLPVIYGNTGAQDFMWLNLLGLVIWCIGFYFEAYGDYQLKQFKKVPGNKGKLMDRGLWSITRHPNYFGDATMWFGIFFIAIDSLDGLWIIIGPVLMAVFLRYVSGVKLLEKKYAGREDYEAYKKRTPPFIPWFPKKVSK
jgi:steroid 5-alpha reductase family enzyme